MDPTQERELVLAGLSDSVDRLEKSLNTTLIPAEGLSFGFALRGARDTHGVAAVPGGIHNIRGKPERGGPCAFDTTEPVVRVILTQVKMDPLMRSAAIIQLSGRIYEILEGDLFLDCAVVNATGPDRGISTLDWSIASACKEGVPDVIFIKAADAKASRLILCGEDPADVANNIIICSNRI